MMVLQHSSVRNPYILACYNNRFSVKVEIVSLSYCRKTLWGKHDSQTTKLLKDTFVHSILLRIVCLKHISLATQLENYKI